MNISQYRKMVKEIAQSIPELKGYCFGTSQQVMSKFTQQTELYPLLWGEYPNGRIIKDAAVQSKLYQCSIAIMKHVPRQSTEEVIEEAMDTCEAISDTVEQKLIAHFRQPSVNDLFDISTITFRPIEMMFADNLHGWALEFQFSTPWKRFTS